jgi:DNA-binding response OmpR family regulator
LNGSTPETTIYIAEDNPILLQGLDRALRASGYAVVVAEDGHSMLQLLEAAKTPPDLLLLDMMMPQMSGLEVVEAVRSRAVWNDLPIMLITAAADEALPAVARESGVVDVLIKPFRLGDLLGRIERHVRDHRESRAAGMEIPAAAP